MTSKVIEVDFLKKAEDSLAQQEASDLQAAEARKKKLRMLQDLIEQGKYAPSLEAITEALMDNLMDLEATEATDTPR